MPFIGWSDFALAKQKEKGARFNGSPEALVKLVRKYWYARRPGAGRSDLTKVVIVPIREKNLKRLFSCPWIDVKEASRITGHLTRRQPFEDPYVHLQGHGKTLPVTSAEVVLYSKLTLVENDGKRSGPFDWEIVAVLTGPWTNPPMDPLTMARNFLQKPGGTHACYSAQQFAESIYFWSQFVQSRS